MSHTPSSSIVDTIEKRRSVRTYDARPLSPTDRRQLTGCFNTLTNPFGVDVHLHLVDREVEAGGEKLGTYGVIKGASTFLGVSVPKTDQSLLAAGYTFERLILHATAMGLGTVWLAATFRRTGFAQAMHIGDDEWFPAISPVGYPARKPSLRESLMRTSMKSAARKPWSELFFRGDFGAPLSRQDAGDYALCLDMLRLAPSATNAQPWRVVQQGKVYHFYETHSPRASEDEVRIKQVDLGIALCHFHLTALERGLSGKFETRSQEGVHVPDHTWYRVSWVAE